MKLRTSFVSNSSSSSFVVFTIEAADKLIDYLILRALPGTIIQMYKDKEGIKKWLSIFMQLQCHFYAAYMKAKAAEDTEWNRYDLKYSKHAYYSTMRYCPRFLQLTKKDKELLRSNYSFDNVKELTQKYITEEAVNAVQGYVAYASDSGTDQEANLRWALMAYRHTKHPNSLYIENS